MLSVSAGTMCRGFPAATSLTPSTSARPEPSALAPFVRSAPGWPVTAPGTGLALSAVSRLVCSAADLPAPSASNCPVLSTAVQPAPDCPVFSTAVQPAPDSPVSSTAVQPALTGPVSSTAVQPVPSLRTGSGARAATQPVPPAAPTGPAPGPVDRPAPAPGPAACANLRPANAFAIRRPVSGACWSGTGRVAAGSGGPMTDGPRGASPRASAVRSGSPGPPSPVPVGAPTRDTPHGTVPVAYGRWSTPSLVHWPEPANQPLGAGS